MNLPDSFPKQFHITLAIDMKALIGAGISEWGRILKQSLNSAEYIAAEEIRDFRLRSRIFHYYGVDPGEKFEMDYRYAWVDIDGAIQLLRIDMLPLTDRSLDFEIACMDGKYEQVYDEKNDEWYFKEVKKD